MTVGVGRLKWITDLLKENLKEKSTTFPKEKDIEWEINNLSVNMGKMQAEMGAWKSLIEGQLDK